MKRAICAILSVIVLLATVGPLVAGRGITRPRSIAADDYWHFHNVGNLGLTITNYGILGQGYNVEGQPSCMYKLHTNLLQEQVEHFPMQESGSAEKTGHRVCHYGDLRWLSRTGDR